MRLKQALSIPMGALPSSTDLQHRLLHREGGLEPGDNRAAVRLIQPNHHSVGSVLSLWGTVQMGVQTPETSASSPTPWGMAYPPTQSQGKEQTMLNNNSLTRCCRGDSPA